MSCMSFWRVQNLIGNIQIKLKTEKLHQLLLEIPLQKKRDREVCEDKTEEVNKKRRKEPKTEITTTTTTTTISEDPQQNLCKIPKKVKDDNWLIYIGRYYVGNCFSCKGYIDAFNYECFPLVSNIIKKNNVKNLRPICLGCHKVLKIQYNDITEYLNDNKYEESIDTKNKRKLTRADNQTVVPNYQQDIETDKITESVRRDTWITYNENKFETKCPICNEEIITVFNFECSHVISRNHHGGNSIYNLRPICHGCNRSMSRRDMDEYTSEYYLDAVVLKTFDKNM